MIAVYSYNGFVITILVLKKEWGSFSWEELYVKFEITCNQFRFRTFNQRINRLHEGVLWNAYDNYLSDFKELKMIYL